MRQALVTINLFIVRAWSRVSGSLASAAVGIVGGDIGHILFAELGRDRAHGGVLARAGLVVLERLHDVAGALAAELRYGIHLGVGGAVVGDAMASLARPCLLPAGGG